MDWKYVKPLSSEDSIKDFERLVNYSFSDDFKECVLHNNGGCPDCKVFNTDKTEGRVLKTFLSFNKDGRDTVWKIHDWNKNELADRYIAFAIDNFGNLICFDKISDSIVFINHESMEVETIALCFSEFMKMLYE